MKKKFRMRKRLDVCGAGFLASTLTIALAAVAFFAVGVPYASAGIEETRSKSNSGERPAAVAGEHSKSTVLDKKFKGKLPITELTEDEAIMHAMNRLGYGPRPGDVEYIRKTGLEKWVDQQLHPESINDSALDQRLQRYPTLNLSAKKLIEEYPQPGQVIKKEGITKQEYEQRIKEKQRDAESQVIVTGNENLDKAQQQLAKLQGPGRIVAELSMAKVDRAVYSNRQLQVVMEDFWFNHFNVFAQKAEDKWLLPAYVRETIRPRTMGKFEDLLLATAKSPAMLIYLDNFESADPDAVRRMEAEKAMRRARYGGAFAGGDMPTPGTFPGPVTSTSVPGATPGAAAKKQERGLNENYGREVMELHTVGVDGGYTQQDVVQMAKCLTGWTVRAPRKDPEFFFDDRIHAQGKKVVMGRTFSYGGQKDGEEALKMLANHPNTATFISTELARHFVSDNPPPALVERMAAEYSARQGDIRSVLKTMIYSPEFWSKEAYRAKVKTPYELVASTARALNAEVTITLPTAQWVARMGEPLFLCQTPNGYSDKAETWVNTGALLNRLNFALSFATDKVAGATVDLKSTLGAKAAQDPNATLAKAINDFLGDQIAQQTRETLVSRLNDPQILQASLDDPVKQVNEGLIAGLVLGAPEFQRR
jgi:uncharacterized protein (DUF1800 family)